MGTKEGMDIITEGDPGRPAFVFLHGWPETARCWREIMRLAGESAYAVAFDLPGIGANRDEDPTDGTKAALAKVVHEVVKDLRDVTIVGHDCGGMIAYAYLRAYAAKRVVIMNTVIPGVAPWEDVRRNPYIWHFGFHAVPDLPELMTKNREKSYFNYFYNVLSPTPDAVPQDARDEYAEAYRNTSAGFDWYRAFPKDAEANAKAADVATPLLYLRGEREGGDIAAYAAGLRASGVRNVSTAVIPGAGHFAPDQTPTQVWELIKD